MFGLLQPAHLLIILLILVLVLGPNRLRGIGRSIGQGWHALLGGFRDSTRAAPPQAALPARECVRCGVWSGEVDNYCTRCGTPLP